MTSTRSPHTAEKRAGSARPHSQNTRDLLAAEGAQMRGPGGNAEGPAGSGQGQGWAAVPTSSRTFGNQSSSLRPVHSLAAMQVSLGDSRTTFGTEIHSRLSQSEKQILTRRHPGLG